ncbi:acyltransferase ChoActase/COT/CPT [Zopfochytrium polystomum]|nr:acyltransferase ChoActase/COT/CPT [Zopfochytrium polystomum]
MVLSLLRTAAAATAAFKGLPSGIVARAARETSSALIVPSSPAGRSFAAQRTPVARFSSSPSAGDALLKTFDNQSLLPRLPVPTLQSTAAKYLKTLEPLLTPEQLQQSQERFEEFIKEGGLGETAQARLVKLDAQEKGSWLYDIWLRYAYLMYREPSLINVNWWSLFNDHPEQPEELLRKPPPPGVFSSFQIKRAAGLVNSMLNFKQLLDSEQLPPDYIRRMPLCMHQYKNMFGIARVPGQSEDTIRFTYPATANHIIVLARDQIYRVPVLHADGSRVSLAELERVLFAVTRDSLQSSSEAPIGLLTAGDRDNWFEAYEAIVKLSPQNAENMEIIHSSLFALALDDFSARQPIDTAHQQIFHNFDARNRWFDKTLHLIVASNGRAGLNGEHSPLDAIVPGRLMDFLVESEPAIDGQDFSKSDPLPAPTKLKWTVNEKVTDAIARSKSVFQPLIDDTYSAVLIHKNFGSRYIKEVAKTSPDSYVQLAIQLTWRRMHGSPTAIYESCSTRQFHYGRTETGRSLTSETRSFVDVFDDDNVLYDEKRDLFNKAVSSHSTYIREATAGQGVDRHLLGLKVMLTPEELASNEAANVFADPAFKKSSYFRLSTSNVSPGRNWFAGFGPVVPDGYGVAYAIDEDSIKFAISAKKSARKVDAKKFRETLERSLKDLMIMFPKRSEVWGHNWRAKLEREKKEVHFLKTMKKLSDQYVAEKEVKGNRIAKGSDKS